MIKLNGVKNEPPWFKNAIRSTFTVFLVQTRFWKLFFFSFFIGFVGWLVISLYLSSLPIAYLSDAPRRRLVVTRDSARIQNETTESSACSLACSLYSTVTREFGLKTLSNFSLPAGDSDPQPVVTRNIVFTSPTLYLLSYIGWLRFVDWLINYFRLFIVIIGNFLQVIHQTYNRILIFITPNHSFVTEPQMHFSIL